MKMLLVILFSSLLFVNVAYSQNNISFLKAKLVTLSRENAKLKLIIQQLNEEAFAVSLLDTDKQGSEAIDLKRNELCRQKYNISFGELVVRQINVQKAMNNINYQISQLHQKNTNTQEEKYLQKERDFQAKLQQIEDNYQERLVTGKKSRNSGVHILSLGSSGHICADCGGSGKREVRLNGQWIKVECRSCSGSGDAGYFSDYIESGGRTRSLFEQDLGRMFGTK